MRHTPLIVATAAFGALLGGCATSLETGPGYYHYDTHAVGSPPPGIVREEPAVVYRAPVVASPTAVVTSPPTLVNGQPAVVYTNPPLLYGQPGVIYQPAVVEGDSVLMYRTPQPAANSAYAHDHGQ
jgi:hypothetical protein